MKKAMLVSVAVMVCTAMAFAQQTPSGSAAGQDASQTPSATQSTTEQTASGNPIQGCLTGTTGNYVLTDSAGVAYKLKGDESQLADFTNKEVEVMGTVGSKAADASGHAGDAAGDAAGGHAGEAAHAAGEAAHAAGEAAGEATGVHAAGKTLEVSSVKKIADSCK